MGLERALELAYRHLGRCDRTAVEMRGHLLGKDVEEADADAAIAALEEQGYLDDARYARVFAEDRRALDSWGSERIERRLHELGVDREHVAAALGVREPEEELQAAVALLERRLGAAPQTDRERERALGLLVRRGYDLELAHEAVRCVARARL